MPTLTHDTGMAFQCENCGLVMDARQPSSSVHEVAPSHCPGCGQYVIWNEQPTTRSEPEPRPARGSIARRVRKLFQP